MSEINKNGIDVANLFDEQNYKQTPIFFATVIKDEAIALKMTEVLAGFGAKPS